jgi:hypothetical protein
MDALNALAEVIEIGPAVSPPQETELGEAVRHHVATRPVGHRLSDRASAGGVVAELSLSKAIANRDLEGVRGHLLRLLPELDDVLFVRRRATEDRP